MKPIHNNSWLASHARRTKKHRGFTLIELMIVVVIISILAAIVYPMYSDQIRKSRRATAHSTLTDAAARQEQFFLDNKSYADDMNKLGYGVAAGVGVPFEAPEAFYNVTIDAETGACPIATCYSITATAINAQVDDTACPTLTLDSRGNKTPVVGNCW